MMALPHAYSTIVTHQAIIPAAVSHNLLTGRQY